MILPIFVSQLDRTQVMSSDAYDILELVHFYERLRREEAQRDDEGLKRIVDCMMDQAYRDTLAYLERYLPAKAAEMAGWYAMLKASFCLAVDAAGVDNWRGRMVGFDRALVAADLEACERAKQL